MNPLTGTLSRMGFLFWSIIILPLDSVGFLAAFNDTPPSNLYWFLFALVALANLLILARRLENAGYSAWLAILAFLLTPIGWIPLFIIPSQVKTR